MKWVARSHSRISRRSRTTRGAGSPRYNRACSRRRRCSGWSPFFGFRRVLGYIAFGPVSPPVLDRDSGPHLIDESPVVALLSLNQSLAYNSKRSTEDCRLMGGLGAPLPGRQRCRQMSLRVVIHYFGACKHQLSPDYATLIQPTIKRS